MGVTVGLQEITTEEFQNFMEKHFNAEEITTYRLAVKRLVKVGPSGQLEFCIEDGKGAKKYRLYFYRGQRALYALMAHFERRGEPTDKFLETLKDCIEQVKQREADYENRRDEEAGASFSE